jgi:DNA ligase-1
MRAFSELYEELDTTTSTNLKVDAMVRYFKSAPPRDAAWAAYTVGDLAETIALLTESSGDGSARQAPEVSLSAWLDERLLPLRGEDETRQRAAIVNWWHTLPYRESFLVNKFLTDELRVGVSQLLVTRALSEVLSMPR